MKYGGLSEEEAVRLITLNPARQLEIDNRTGSIDTGKDADLAIWNGHPFSTFSRVETTFIDGEIFFDRAQDGINRLALERERQTLEKMDANKAPGTGGTAPRIPSEKRKADLDDADDIGGNQ